MRFTTPPRAIRMNLVVRCRADCEDDVVSGERPLPTDAELVDAILTSPIGATVLWALIYELSPELVGARSRSVTRRALARAEVWVSDVAEGDLVVALSEAVGECGPFSGFQDEVAERVSTSRNLRPLAEALVGVHRSFLAAPVVLEGQWCGFEGPRRGRDDREPPLTEEGRLFGDMSATYECGEFPLRAWMTHDPVPDEAVHAVLSGDDSFLDDQTSLWRFPVVAEVPVAHEVVVPEDWTDLLNYGALGVQAFRRVEEGGGGVLLEPDRAFLQSHASWDCAVVAVGDDGLATVRAADGRTFTEVRGLVMPDWNAVATHFDAVHFTWMGILTTEARILKVSDRWLTTARFWGTPSTLWFRDVFGPAEPLPVPVIRGRTRRGGLPDSERLARDRRILRSAFGRDSAVPGNP